MEKHLVQLLIESGANIAATDEQGCTVFYRAAYYGAVDVFKVRRFHICKILYYLYNNFIALLTVSFYYFIRVITLTALLYSVTIISVMLWKVN